jgi:hypothetical protein
MSAERRRRPTDLSAFCWDRSHPRHVIAMQVYSKSRFLSFRLSNHRWSHRSFFRTKVNEFSSSSTSQVSSKSFYFIDDRLNQSSSPLWSTISMKCLRFDPSGLLQINILRSSPFNPNSSIKLLPFLDRQSNAPSTSYGRFRLRTFRFHKNLHSSRQESYFLVKQR